MKYKRKNSVRANARGRKESEVLVRSEGSNETTGMARVKIMETRNWDFLWLVLGGLTPARLVILGLLPRWVLRTG